MKIELSKNEFKAAIKRGRPQIGIWSTLGNAVCAELISDAGFDWVLFDSEHSPVEVAGLLPLLQAAERGSSHSAIRVAWNDTVLIKKALDIGAQTLLVPFIQNSDEARLAVQACQYPPNGVRGVAGSTRATRYGRTSDYLERAGEEICLIVQAETETALENIQSIAKTEGVDGIFIGPSDLSASMGCPGKPDDSRVQAAIQEAVSQLTSLRVPAGILARNATEALHYVELGFSFVAAGSDASLLAKAVDDLRDSVADVPK